MRARTFPACGCCWGASAATGDIVGIVLAEGWLKLNTVYEFGKKWEGAAEGANAGAETFVACD